MRANQALGPLDRTGTMNESHQPSSNARVRPNIRKHHTNPCLQLLMPTFAESAESARCAMSIETGEKTQQLPVLAHHELPVKRPGPPPVDVKETVLDSKHANMQALCNENGAKYQRCPARVVRRRHQYRVPQAPRSHQRRAPPGVISSSPCLIVDQNATSRDAFA